MVFRRLFSSCCGPGDHPAPPALRVGQVPKEVRGGAIPDPPWQDRGSPTLPGLSGQWSRSEAFPQAPGKGLRSAPLWGWCPGWGTVKDNVPLQKRRGGQYCLLGSAGLWGRLTSPDEDAHFPGCCPPHPAFPKHWAGRGVARNGGDMAWAL